MVEEYVRLSPPLHLVCGETDCWKCGAVMPLVAILCKQAANSDHGPFVVAMTTELPHRLAGFIQQLYPTYRLTESNTAREKYYANNCPICDTISGDFYLHFIAGAPFFPTDAEEASQLSIQRIPFGEEFLIRGSCGSGAAALILEYAARRPEVAW